MLLPIPDLTRVGFDVNAKGLPRLQAEHLGRARPAQPGQARKLILINAYGTAASMTS